MLIVFVETVTVLDDGPVPNAAIRKPEIAGPTNLPKWKFALLRLIAFVRSSRPTISILKLWRIGASIAAKTPKRIAST